MKISILQGLSKIFLILTIMVFALIIEKAYPSSPSYPNSLDESSKESLVAQLFKLPISFESNLGQTDDKVKYLHRGKAQILFFTPDEIVMAFNNADQDKPNSVLRMLFSGASLDPTLIGMEEQSNKSHYFIGNNPEKWHTDIPNFAKLFYHDVYPGIDVIFYGNQQQLEFDICVSPGAHPEQIRLQIDGSKEISLDSDGNLCILTDADTVQLQKPFIYQIDKEAKIPIEGNFTLLSSNEIGFCVASYDPSKLLVIDPILDYSTYLGGLIQTIGVGIAVDSAGSAYVTGFTQSTNFPTMNPFQPTLHGIQDAFVTKFTPSGTALVYSTYLGGSSQDMASCIAVDSSGSAYVAGTTFSTNFPLMNAFQPTLQGGQDAFVTKFNSAGSALVYSTYLGGNSVDDAFGIAVDSSGSAYVVGDTFSTNFPVVNAFQPIAPASRNAFVTKFNPAGTALVYSTYLGGSATDQANGVAVDSAGSAYVTGLTLSTNFPTLNPFQPTLHGTQDAFITKFSPSGTTLVYSTYLGGTGAERGLGIAVDSTGSAYVAGQTSSTNFPIVNAFQSTLLGTTAAFVTKFSPSGTSLIYSTYLGGSSSNLATGVALDSSNNAYVTGQTTSTNFPTLNAIQPTFGGVSDAFVTKFNASGNTVAYSTFLGGSAFDLGNAIAVDSNGNAYVTGQTSSTNFPTQNAFQPTRGGSTSAFVTKIGTTPPVVTGIVPNFGPDTGGTTVIITGAGFTGTTSVHFGSVSAIFVVNSDTQITAISPPGNGVVDVIVTNPGGTSPRSPADLFTYIPLSPLNFIGFQVANIFATQTEYVNILKWNAPTNGTTPIFYQIYRDAQLTDLIATIPANAKLIFEDHNRKKGKQYTYFLVSVDVFGHHSLPVSLIVK